MTQAALLIDELIKLAADKLGRLLRILVIDDEENCYILFTRAVPHCEYAWAMNGARGLEILERDPKYFDAVVVDQRLPNGEMGHRVIAEIWSRWSRDVFCVLSSFLSEFDRETAEEMAAIGPFHMIPKPISDQSVRDLISEIGRRRGGA